MDIQTAINHFGSQSSLAKALGVSRTAVCKMVERGYLPSTRQRQIESITNGDLKADPEPWEQNTT